MALTAPFSMQLYSARNFPPMSQTLETVAGLGYTNVEPFGGLFEDIRGLEKGLADNKLTALTAHMGLDDLQGKFDDMVAKAKALGIGTVIVPAPSGSWSKSQAEWVEVGQAMTEMADKLAGKNLKLAWHNHDVEFAAMEDGRFPIEVVLGDGILWEADLAWVVRGGQAPKTWLEKYSGRLVAAHVKDIAALGECADEDGWADVGHGTLDWASLWQVAVGAGAQVMVAEHDNPSDFDRFASRSLASMKQYAAAA